MYTKFHSNNFGDMRGGFDIIAPEFLVIVLSKD